MDEGLMDAVLAIECEVLKMTWEYSNYLAHHGIKGQQWGVRRFQNEDGTLTAEGRARLAASHTKDIEFSMKKVKQYEYDKDTIEKKQTTA